MYMRSCWIESRLGYRISSLLLVFVIPTFWVIQPNVNIVPSNGPLPLHKSSPTYSLLVYSILIEFYVTSVIESASLYIPTQLFRILHYSHRAIPYIQHINKRKAPSKIQENTNHKTHFMLSANSYMFRYQYATLKAFFDNKVSRDQPVL